MNVADSHHWKGNDAHQSQWIKVIILKDYSHRISSNIWNSRALFKDKWIWRLLYKA